MPRVAPICITSFKNVPKRLKLCYPSVFWNRSHAIPMQRSFFSTKTEELKTKMETSLDTIINWMRASGLKVNEEKTELCLFYRTMPPSLTLQIGNQMVSTTPFMNVLGVLFDATMKWTYQV